MEKNVEITENGLKCDNPQCDWKDATIGFDTYKECINKPCPKCGQNVLTEEDYMNAEIVRLSADFINSLSIEELSQLSKSGVIDIEKLKQDLMFSETKGLEQLNGNDKVVMSVSTHKEIKINEIRKVDDNG